MPLSLELPVESLALELMDESLAWMRIARPRAEKRMQGSLEKHGQLSAVMVWKRQARYEMVDGFKRLRAARRISGWTKLSARIVEGDEGQAKLSLLMLEQQGTGLSAVEEAWGIQSLHREHQMPRAVIASALCRPQSWVGCRLALAERLIGVAAEAVRVGLLAPTTARTLAGMPRCLQEPMLATIQREALTSREARTLAKLMAGSGREHQKVLMAHVGELLDRQATRPRGPNLHPRLGVDARRLQRQLQKLESGCLELRGRLFKSEQLKLTMTEQGLVDSSMRSLREQLGWLLETLDCRLNPPVDL